MVKIGDALRRQCGRVSLIILLMIYHNRIHDCMRLLCQALVQLSQAPWRKLFEHGDEHFRLHMTGLTREAFSPPMLRGGQISGMQCAPTSGVKCGL
jgi:hypothetical protein